MESKRKIRVLIIAHSFVVPGYLTLPQKIAEDPGLDVTLVVPDKWFECGQWVRPTIAVKGNLKVVICRPLGYRQHSHVYPALPGILRRTAPDFVLLFEEPNSILTASTLFLLSKLCPKAKSAFFTFINDDRVFSDMGLVRSVIFQRALSTTFSLATAAIGSSLEACNQMRRRGFAGPVFYVPFGVDAGALSKVDASEASAIRKRLLCDGTFLVGFVGRLSREKGVDLLLDALVPSLPGLRFAIVGDGPDRPALEARAVRLGLTHKGQFLGAVAHEKIGAHIKAFDCLVVPSRRLGDWVEQFGRVVVEGLALGVPVVGSDSGEIPNILKGCGFVHKEDSPESLRAQLEKVYSIPVEARAQLMESARRKVMEVFDYGATACRYREIIYRALENNKGTP